VFRARERDPLDTALEVGAPAREDEVPEGAEATRHGFRKEGAELRLSPALPDRPMVVASEIPFFLLPGEEVTLYVGIPLWTRIEAGAAPKLLLDEPIFRPSDTWFGPSTRVGDLCYATRTRALQDLPRLIIRPQRAVCVLTVRNRGQDPLPLQRLRLPMAPLSVYAGGDGRLWTEALTLERQTEDDMASATLGSGPPPASGGARHVGGPRQAAAPGTLVRAFAGLFGAKEMKWLAGSSAWD
jgi:hypothetical protein